MQTSRESEVSGVTAEDAEEISGPMLIGALESHGISAADIKKLKEAGYNTVESIVYAPKKNLVSVL
jgi:DNA repair protein RAD51